jgi:putative transposase
VLNCANKRATIFHHAGDYAAFEKALAEALLRNPLELFAYCLMPNHFHLVRRPQEDGQLSEFMRWLTVTHTQRYHAAHHSGGTGHLYQGRFKSFVVESDEHFLVLCRYVERNPVRPHFVPKAEDWRWGSLWRRANQQEARLLSAWPVNEPTD